MAIPHFERDYSPYNRDMMLRGINAPRFGVDVTSMTDLLSGDGFTQREVGEGGSTKFLLQIEANNL